MTEARDRLSRGVDIAEQYRIRLGRMGRGAGGIVQVFEDADELAVGTPFRWGSIGLTGSPAAGSAAATGGVGTTVRRTPSARRGRENISQIGRARGSVLPSWYPRRPLQDITYIVKAYERRRARLREREHEEAGDQTAHHPSTANSMKEELQKFERTPRAKKAEREKKVRTLLSMR